MAKILPLKENSIATEQNSFPGHSLMADGIPFPPRPCFNWLPQYRYGLFAYKALQQACANILTHRGDGVEFAQAGSRGACDVPVHLIRPVLMDSVLRQKDWIGYVRGQAEDVLRPFSSGELFYPLTSDLALIVAREQGSAQLLNNILSYMTPAPATLQASLALGGGYAGASQAEIAESHAIRKAGAEKLQSVLCGMYGIKDKNLLRIHSAGVGGLIEAATRYMHFLKPGYRSCILAPEYWDLLRCLLTYSPQSLDVVEGREQEQFPEGKWLAAISKPDVDFSYISYTNNPLGTTVPYASMLKAIEAIPDDALFFIDCTSVDTEESSGVDVIKDILKKFPHKNLAIAKSFSKEYNKGHLRVGYAIFTRSGVAEAMWPYMAGYPPAWIASELLSCIERGNAQVLGAYRKIAHQLQEFAASRPHIRVSGTASNYTTLFFKSEQECSDARAKIESAFGQKVFPGELPMQGGGPLGLGQGEVSLTSMKRIPYLPVNGLRILVTDETVANLSKVL